MKISQAQTTTQTTATHLIPKHNPELVVTKEYKKLMEKLSKLQDMNFPVLLVGHCGVGKDQSILEVACRLKKPVILINCSGDMRANSLLGRISSVVDESDKTNPVVKLMWQDGLVTTAVREGYWLILDEMNSLDADILFAIHGLLDNGYISIANNSEIVYAHPDFRLFATMNPNSYFGVKTLNQALVDRFAVVEVKPDDEIDEALVSRLAVPKEVKTSLVSLVKVMRDAYTNPEQQATTQFFGHRALHNVVKLSAEFDLLDAIDMAFINKLPVEEQNSIRALAKDLLKVIKTHQKEKKSLKATAKMPSNTAEDIADILVDSLESDSEDEGALEDEDSP